MVASTDAGRPRLLILAVQADLPTESGVASAAAQISAEFGGVLDVLVHNAGGCETPRPIPESDMNDYWSPWKVNDK